MKTFWEKEKMLVTSIFSFSHNVFYPIKETKSATLICHLQMLLIWLGPKIRRLVKRVKDVQNDRMLDLQVY